MQARDLRVGDKLRLYRRGMSRVLTVRKVWHWSKSTMVDYNDGTSDLWRPWDDVSNQYVTDGKPNLQY